MHTGEGNNILIQRKANILTLSALVLMCVSSWGKYEALSKTNASHPALLFLSIADCSLEVKVFSAGYMSTGLIKIIKLGTANLER